MKPKWSNTKPETGGNICQRLFEQGAFASTRLSGPMRIARCRSILDIEVVIRQGVAIDVERYRL
jgi:hypothetical protein